MAEHEPSVGASDDWLTPPEAALFYSHELAPFTGRGPVLASRD